MNEDLKPFLKKGPQYAVADALYRFVFQPILDLFDRLQRSWTKKWVESNLHTED